LLGRYIDFTKTNDFHGKSWFVRCWRSHFAAVIEHIPEFQENFKNVTFASFPGYLVSAVAYFLCNLDNVCVQQSIITTYSSLVSFYLTVAIAVHIFTTVVFRKDSTSSMKFFICVNIICWVVPGKFSNIAARNILAYYRNLC
jgi:hypothetical protein